MRFSVIIPCHNAAPWIGQALHSVAGQGLPAHEIIVINDRSTDASLDAVRSSGVPVRLLESDAGNAAVARNLGIAAATGDWIAFLDADDIWQPHHLARAARLLEGTGDVAFMANHDWIGLDGAPLPMPADNTWERTAPASSVPAEEFFELMEEPFHFGHSTVVYRADRVREVGGFEPSQVIRHDIDLWLRVLAGRTWAYDTVKHAGYRLDTPGSLSKKGMECHYFYARAMDRNASAYTSAAAQRHRGRLAQTALSAMLTHGTVEQRRSILPLCLPHLDTRRAVVFRMAYLLRGISVPLILWKRNRSAKIREQQGKNQDQAHLPPGIGIPQVAPTTTPRRLVPVSVVIPTRNRAASLRETMAGLFRQTVLPTEIVIVDASSDENRGTPVVSDALPEFDSRVRVKHVPADRAGAAPQRNQGCALATQPWVLFMDDDIRPEPSCLEKLWTAVQSDPALGGVSALLDNGHYHPPRLFSSLLFSWLNGGRAKSYAGRCLGPGLTLLPDDSPDLPEINAVDWLPTGTVLYRREALPVPPFPAIFGGASLAEDLALSLIVARNWKLANVRTARARHREPSTDPPVDWAAMSEMEVLNRHYILRHILRRRDWHSEFQFWFVQLVLLPTTLFQKSGLRRYPFLLLGRLRALARILTGHEAAPGTQLPRYA